MNSDPLQAVLRVIDVLEELGVRYHVGGSWASSIVKEQGGRLDREYLRHWAEDLGVSDLLEKALGSRLE